MRADRRDAVRERLASAEAAAVLVTNLTNIRYLAGFSGSSATLLLTGSKGDILFTDGRYATQARAEVDAGVKTSIVDRPVLKASREWCTDRGMTRVAFEPASMTVEQWTRWRDAGGAELIATEGWVEAGRRVKSMGEIEALREAARMADRAFAALLDEIRIGISERQLALALLGALVDAGSSGEAFESIVLFGERTAMPHGKPGERRLERGDLIQLDFGAVVAGYRSDMSRVVALGPPPPELAKVYDIALDAQQRALEGIVPGMTGAEADALARQPIVAAGYGESFKHSTGHGVGLDVHEQPSLSARSTTKLEAGVVVTVEPGIYISGLGGVRIEDTVWLGSTSTEVLTTAPKDELITLS